MRYKVCNKCKVKKALEEFPKSKKIKGGYTGICKDCFNAWVIEHRRDPKIRQYHTEYYRKYRSTLTHKIKEWKRNAKRRNISWNLTDEYIKSMPMTCYITGESLTLESNNDNTVSLDRINSDKPYEVGNVAFCGTFVNRVKSDKTLEELKTLCRLILNHSK